MINAGISNSIAILLLWIGGGILLLIIRRQSNVTESRLWEFRLHNESQLRRTMEMFVELSNQQAQRIAELERRVAQMERDDDE